MTYNNEQETGRLLCECDAGIEMGISPIDDMLSKAADPELEQLLSDSKQEHIALRNAAQPYKGQGKITQSYGEGNGDSKI